MATFRRSHGRGGAGQSAGRLIRTAIFSIVLILLYFGFREFAGMEQAAQGPIPDVEDLRAADPQNIFFLPEAAAGNLIKHQYLALSYMDSMRLPEWVAYELTVGRLSHSDSLAEMEFRPDPAIRASPGNSLYKSGDWLAAQFAPSADLAFNRDALAETQFTSNAAPQLPGPANQLWKALEARVRDWVRECGHLYIVSGPVIQHPVKNWAGIEKVAVPSAYYKVLLDLRDPNQKAIAFVIPGQPQAGQPLEAFATSIDEVEALTGINFFPQLMEPGLEARLEASKDMAGWSAPPVKK